jgi:DNA ligase-1
MNSQSDFMLHVCLATENLQVKRFLDDEVKVIGYEPGKGKYKGMTGSLQCRLRNGLTVNVGSGMSDAERRNPPPVGSIITIKFQELTDGNIPRFPTFIGVRIDANWP